MNNDKLSCVSLFSGCGGLDLGLERAGFSILAATDFVPVCAESYAKNFRKTPFLVTKIGKLSAKELMDASGVSSPGVIDLLAGGPPCPAFSKSRFYRKEKPRALDDPVAAETVGGYLRMLHALRPKAFLLENVKGLAYGIHRDALDTILNGAIRLGYSTSVRIVNAADYGVPQIRERCIVIGSMAGEIPVPTPSHCKNDALLSQLKPWISAGAAIGDLDTEENASDTGHYAGGRHHDLLRAVPPGENYLYFTEKRGYPEPIFKWRSRYWSFLLKLSPDMPSWTIQARRSNNMGPFHWRNRILRISEIKRLQTFPDDFELAGTVEQQWRQIGNAVPPLLAQKLGKTISDHLLHAELTSRQAA